MFDNILKLTVKEVLKSITLKVKVKVSIPQYGSTQVKVSIPQYGSTQVKVSIPQYGSTQVKVSIPQYGSTQVKVSIPQSFSKQRAAIEKEYGQALQRLAVQYQKRDWQRGNTDAITSG
ncbi:F-BAR and double SH3 domains protein 1, partial [Larimichthys crocea]